MNSLTHPSYTKDKRTFSILDEGNSGIGGKIGEILAPRRDKFLEERPLQPKKAVQEYVASHGILIPQQFSSLEEAFASGKKFIIRSEHPQEYDGVSGLSESFVVDLEEIEKYRASKTPEELKQPAITIQEIKDEKLHPNNEFHRKERGRNLIDSIRKRKLIGATLSRFGYISEEKILGTLGEFSRNQYKRYADKFGLDTESLFQKQTYSFWEYIDGINHTVVADIHIPGRYYIISKCARKGKNIEQEYVDILIIKDGKIIKESGYNYVSNGKQIHRKDRKLKNRGVFDEGTLINLYNHIKNLPNFNPEHCPIMEFQTSRSGDSYFLQYHRGRDKVETINFSIERELEEGEFESPFFRGITPLKGYEVDVAYYYPDTERDDGTHNLCEEEASLDTHWDEIFIDIMSRKRKVNFHLLAGIVDDILDLAGGHISISKVFKPEIFIGIPKQYEEYYDSRKIFELTEKLGVAYRVKIRVISDGKKCYVKFITTPEEVEADFQKYCDEKIS